MTEMFIEIRIYCIHRNYRLGSDACYFDGFSIIGCPLHFNYRRQKMFQRGKLVKNIWRFLTHCRRKTLLEIQHSPFRRPCDTCQSLAACSQSAIIFFVYYFRNFAGLKDNRYRIFRSNCLYPQRFKPDFSEKPLRYRKIKFRKLQ